MAQENLADILTRLKSDDKTVLRHIFDMYYVPVCKAIQRFVRDKSTVEDIAQDVFIKLWEKRHQLNITSSLGAYLRRMAINEAISFLRRHKHFETEDTIDHAYGGSPYTGEDQMLQSELEQNITNAINSLPPKCRAVFQLSRYEGLSYKEIAAKMDISIKTVENQMGKALRVLREKLKGYLSAFLIIFNSFL